MRTAKSYKIVLLLTTFLISLIAFFVCMGTPTGVLAAKPTDATKYFSGTAQEISFKDNGVSAKFEKDSTLELENRLVLDNLGFELKVDANVKSFELSFTTESYLANGNEFIDDEKVEYKTYFTHTLKIEINGADIVATFNGSEQSAILSNDGILNIKFKVENNRVFASVEGNETTNEDAKYLVKDIDYCIAEEITFKALELKEGQTTTTLLLLSIDQDTTDTAGNKKQTFKLNSNNEVEGIAEPCAKFSDKAYNADGEVYVKKFYQTEFSMMAFSVFTNIKAANLSVNAVGTNNDVVFENVDYPKRAIFKRVGVSKIAIKCALADYVGMTLREINVNVYENEQENDNSTPKYDLEKVAELNAYKKAVEKATKVYDEDLGKDVYINLGDNYLVPSLRNLVKDNYTSYENLTKTIYYTTPTKETSSTTTSQIPIDAAGDYTFYVVFSDGVNKMEKEDFFTVSESDENVIEEEGKYFGYVFHFHIEDEAEFSIDATKKQGVGYTGVLYTATNFVFNANNYTDVYKLYFNEKENATSNDDGWVEIIQSKNLKDNYSNSVFTADDIKAIGYNGEMTFKPIKVGTYRITCEITSDNTARSSMAECFIPVKESITVVPYEPLETREVLAIVFLSVGGLCLIGIIALIFVKPKEKTDAEDNN